MLEIIQFIDLIPLLATTATYTLVIALILAVIMYQQSQLQLYAAVAETVDIK